jgi:hypothetical protein
MTEWGWCGCGSDWEEVICQLYTKVSRPIPLPVSAAPIFNSPGHLKGKVYRRTGHERPKREWSYSSTLSLTSALDGVGGQRHTLAALPSRKIQYPTEPVWTSAEKLASTGIRSSDRPARNESLYRLFPSNWHLAVPSHYNSQLNQIISPQKRRRHVPPKRRKKQEYYFVKPFLEIPEIRKNCHNLYDSSELVILIPNFFLVIS